MQILVNTLYAAALIILVAIGAQIVYSATRFFHFAHGAILPLAAYLTYSFSRLLGFPLAVSALLAIVLTGVVGAILELILFNPIRRRGASGLIMLLVSLGLYTVIINVLAAIFGDTILSFRTWPVQEGYSIWGARVTGLQITTLCIGFVGIVVTRLILHGTSIGIRIRALANDQSLARVVGIATRSTYSITMAWASCIGGIAGVLTAADLGATPHMGMRPLMYAVVAMIVGGNTLGGIVAGSLLLAGASQLSVVVLSARWQDAIVFLILIVFLCARPQGFVGKPLKRIAV
ncbi:MAG: branched-chain amino acid ABC transporter permease [Candidatus Eisenbacteria bacterium]|uniref:Branched-chain amino acid ABC transporter permease n=1 Tax=Eiseniibacteriota bacterium TaxID=2212470 RepID=A0A948RVS8_UNCEI|nr:branched-chain amino acid ABC transporter permease [Candidatus Eisenbacteria bacterium]MBU2690886.1 branched-chain amino acid ABC transporter permease [Candidatus Eisenbacteria bacterium]